MAEERKQKVNADVAAPTPAGLWKKASIALLVLADRGGILRRLSQADTQVRWVCAMFERSPGEDVWRVLVSTLC